MTIIESVQLESSDQCHLCGMMITTFPGPKGELASKDSDTVHKFCSTRDLFGYYLQPEVQHRTTALFVHDMSKSPWASPDDDHFIDAKTAHYVWGSEKKGAMGVTLASFSRLDDAHSFADEFGGQVLAFDDITLQLLGSGLAMH